MTRGDGNRIAGVSKREKPYWETDSPSPWLSHQHKEEKMKVIQNKRDKQIVERPYEVQSIISLKGHIKGIQQAIDIVIQLIHNQQTIRGE